MAVNGTFSIFRLTLTGAANDEETDVSDKVEFDGDALTPDAKSHIQHVKPILSLIGQENTNPDSDNGNSIDETGLAFVGLEITGFLDGNTSASPIAIRSIRNWFKSKDQKIAAYPHGRFGWRNNKNNEFDLTPSSTSGYVIEHFECDEDYESGNRFPFVIKLRFQGAVANLNSVP